MPPRQTNPAVPLVLERGISQGWWSLASPQAGSWPHEQLGPLRTVRADRLRPAQVGKTAVITRLGKDHQGGEYVVKCLAGEMTGLSFAQVGRYGEVRETTGLIISQSRSRRVSSAVMDVRRGYRTCGTGSKRRADRVDLRTSWPWLRHLWTVVCCDPCPPTAKDHSADRARLLALTVAPQPTSRTALSRARSLLLALRMALAIKGAASLEKRPARPGCEASSWYRQQGCPPRCKWSPSGRAPARCPERTARPGPFP